MGMTVEDMYEFCKDMMSAGEGQVEMMMLVKSETYVPVIIRSEDDGKVYLVEL